MITFAVKITLLFPATEYPEDLRHSWDIPETLPCLSSLVHLVEKNKSKVHKIVDSKICKKLSQKIHSGYLLWYDISDRYSINLQSPLTGQLVGRSILLHSITNLYSSWWSWDLEHDTFNDREVKGITEKLIFLKMWTFHTLEPQRKLQNVAHVWYRFWIELYLETL